MKTVERVSRLKAKSSVINTRASNICLAVYPYQIEFTGNLDYASMFYFEKDLQIIGSISNPIAANENNKTIILRDQINLIKFRIYSFQNLHYRWSLYKTYLNGEEEFVQTANLDLKQYLTQLIPLHAVSSSKNQEFCILPNNLDKQLQVRFERSGIVLKFLLLVSEQERVLTDFIKDRFFGKISQQQQQNSSIKHAVQKLQQVSNNTTLEKEVVGKNLLNSQVNLGESKILHSKQAQQVHQIQDLDALIFDNKQKTLGNQQQIHVEKVNNNSQDEDLCFGVEKPVEHQQRQREEDKALINPHGQKQNNNFRDYSLLKLQSDQGRIKMDPIDRRLELEELDVIEEEVGPSKCNQNSKAQSKQNGELPIQTDYSTSKLQLGFNSNIYKLVAIFALIVVIASLLFFISNPVSGHKKAVKRKKIGKK